MNVLQMSQVDNLIPDHIKSSLSEAEVDSDGEINMDRVPFAKNTIRMDLKQIDKSLKAMSAQQNKENKRNMMESDENQNRTCTPVNETEHPGQPLTPTANLKVLFNAMSPELRNRDEQKAQYSDEDNNVSLSQDYEFETIIEVPITAEAENKFGPSRKEKSLGLLCQRFLTMYPEYPEKGEKIEICLDEVASELQVERRRIYDIVNVLESVEIVSRVAKNRYAWHGKRNLGTTLAKLKALGDSERFGEQIQKLKDFEFNRELEEQFGRSDPRLKANGVDADFSIFGESSLFNQALRKDKSLGIMSQKFLMLFLVSKPKTVNLDLSAKLLIGDANIDRTENAKFKTKIRRLYDIANILTSLNLIKKVHVTEIRGRKPAFKYIGPDIDVPGTDVQLTCCSDGCHRPSTRHSILDCIQNNRVAKIIDAYKESTPRSSSSSEGEGDDKVRFSRHSSFETLCAVASVETNKLNSSAPNSPVKGDKASDNKGALSDSEAKLPTRGFVRRRPGLKVDDLSSVEKTADAIIIKTRPQPVKPAMKQPTIIPLTKEQIDAVLRSLKVPVPVKKNQLTDATTQSSPPVDDQMVMNEGYEGVTEVKEEQQVEMKELNEKTPVVMSNTPERIGPKRPAPTGDSIPLEKRVKLTFASPSSLGDDKSPVPMNPEAVLRCKKTADVVKPSPQRALHLTPEFSNPKVSLVPGGDASNMETEERSQGKKIEIVISESGSKLVSPVRRSVQEVVQLSNAQTILIQSPISTSATKSPTVVHLGSQPTTILQLPVQQGQQQRLGQMATTTITLPQGMQLLQNGQHLMQLPISLNSSVPNSPRVITYTFSSPQSSHPTSFTNAQLLSNQNSNKGVGNLSTLIRPVASKATASPQAGSYNAAPSLGNQSPIYLRNSSGGFVPISSVAVNVPKVIVASSNHSHGDLSSSVLITGDTS
ncbi:transcription factor E2F8-like isoform X2 [Dreissena polymorpha]|nr:transcription factor E2F8-like isoform X2 [Dreissena polymorpha]